MPERTAPILRGWSIFDPTTAAAPGLYVVRQWDLFAGGILAHRGPANGFATLHDARASLPSGLHQLTPDPRDGPQLLETWIVPRSPRT